MRASGAVTFMTATSDTRLAKASLSNRANVDGMKPLNATPG